MMTEACQNKWAERCESARTIVYCEHRERPVIKIRDLLLLL